MGVMLTHCFYLLFIFYRIFLHILINIFEPFAPEQGITVKQNDNDLLNATDDALVTQYQTTQTNVLNAFFNAKKSLRSLHYLLILTENIIMFFNNKDSHNEVHPLNQAVTLEISENSPLDAIFSKTGSETSSTYNSFNLMRFSKIKHQAKNAIALSLLATFLMMGGTVEAGLTLNDVGNNNDIATAYGSVHPYNSSVIANGHVSKNDQRDVYSFIDSGAHEGTIQWYLNSISKILSMDVYEDVNRNRILDSSDRFLFRIDQWGSRSMSSSKGTRYLAKVWTNHHATYKYQNYSITFHAPKTLRLSVISARTGQKFDPVGFFTYGTVRPDFYVKTRIGPYGARSKTVANNYSPVFNHYQQVSISPVNGVYPFSIDLYDSDYGSKDDQADIHPSLNKQKLDLVYDVSLNQIRTDDGRVLGQPGRAITVKGNYGGRKKAYVTFILR